jgi:aspartate beta-hydroxylase
MDTQEERIEAKIKELIRSWGLSKFSEGMATHWLMRSISEENMELERLQKWILMQLNHQRIPPNVSSWQIGCPEMIPQLESRALWDTNQFEWIDILEKAFPIIKEELLSLKDKKGFQPYRAPSWASDTNVSAIITKS